MPIYNMACPKCGKASTEYDENKWKCLYCDNKFVFKQDHTVNNNTVNNTVFLNNNAPFNIDPNFVEAKKIYGDIVNCLRISIYGRINSEDDESFSKLISPLNTGRNYGLGTLFAFLIFLMMIGVIAIIGPSNWLWLGELLMWVSVVLLFGTIALCFICPHVYRNNYREFINTKLKRFEIHYASDYFCPYCGKLLFPRISILDSDLLINIIRYEKLDMLDMFEKEGLEIGLDDGVEDGVTHCKSCGKMIYIMDKKLYKIIPL